MGIDIANLGEPVDPWIMRAEEDVAFIVEQMSNPPEFDVRTLQCARMRTLPDLFNQFKLVYDFPSYFGHNLDALDECLADLEWIASKSYVMVLRDIDQLLEDAGYFLPFFLEVLNNVAIEWSQPVELDEWWDRPSVSFHVLLVGNIDRILVAAELASIEIGQLKPGSGDGP